MKIVPDLKVTRYAQLKAGELFLYSHENGLSVAIAAANPVEHGDLYIVTLGPKFPAAMTCPTIHFPNGSSSLLSYGGDYVLRLPACSQAWSRNRQRLACPASRSRKKILTSVPMPLPLAGDSIPATYPPSRVEYSAAAT